MISNSQKGFASVVSMILITTYLSLLLVALSLRIIAAEQSISLNQSALQNHYEYLSCRQEQMLQKAHEENIILPLSSIEDEC
jgi:hypothetical protein